MDRVSSGIDDLDAVLGGLMPGDNVVWVGGDDPLHHHLQRQLFAADPNAPARVFVTTDEDPARVRRRVGDVDILDARRGQPLTDPALLERAVLDRGQPGARVVLDNLDAFVRRLRGERALGLFTRICPQLFDAGAICYWRAGARSRSILDGVRGVTQCVFDVSDGHLRIVKAEGRHGVQGRIFRIRIADGEVRVDHERALGRLAEGLRQLRVARSLTQSEVARIGGVSPSAISQAEAGHRGLGLDTVVAIAEGVGISLDELLGTSPDPGYVIARRDRSATRRGLTALLDDPTAGLRAYLVHLGPGETGAPPELHKGPELVVVAVGLVQIDLGSETPVVRAGDATLATKVPVSGWRNLLATPARLFWIPRDPLIRET
ncbi:MAG: helix-turn-helix domain-containing protein [Acidimicrobiia bacterium]